MRRRDQPTVVITMTVQQAAILVWAMREAATTGELEEADRKYIRAMAAHIEVGRLNAEVAVT